MYTISKEFSFHAKRTSIDKQEQVYQIIVEFQSSYLNNSNLVVDYQEIDLIKKYIESDLTHKHLDKVFNMPNPTVELMAEYLFYELRDLFELPHRSKLSAIIIKGTPGIMAKYKPI